MIEGIQLKTQQFHKEVCVEGCKEFIYYESQLDLVDVTLNTITTYQCTGNIDQQLVSKTISFSIKGRNQPEVEYVQITLKFPLSGIVYDRKIQTNFTAIIAASVTLTLIILLLFGIGIGVKLYLDKVIIHIFNVLKANLYSFLHFFLETKEKT